MIKVLIVEDDPMVAEMNKFYVEQVEGFQTEDWAESAERALELLESRSYDLILLDIYMKGSSGLELLSDIRGQALAADVIVISAASDKESIRQALRGGAVDYLIKPFQFNRLRSALEQYRERSMLFTGSDTLAQAELDSLTKIAKDTARSAPLSKGFTRQTLQAVWRAIEATTSEWFTSEEIASSAGISRVSSGKYLAELQNMGVLEMDFSYGTVGRPVQKYRVTAEGPTRISKFL